MSFKYRVAVLGAGISGLGSAVALQENFHDLDITIIAEKFSPNLTSDIAAGYIVPYLIEGDAQQIYRWTKGTIDQIERYMKEVPNGGAGEMSGYFFRADYEPRPYWASLMKHFVELTPDEIMQKSPKAKVGYFFSTYYLQPTPYIDYLTKRFLMNGGRIESRRVESLNELHGYDAIINCTGLMAGKLTKDYDLHPVRGQVIRYKCDDVKHFFDDHDGYILPNKGFLVIGGTKDKDKWETEINPSVAEEIMRKAIEKMPQLKGGHIISHHVGLRPSRSQVRLEMETLPTGQTVLHNYGHGGSGICLHWGCALEVVHLLQRVRKAAAIEPKVVLSKL